MHNDSTAGATVPRTWTGDEARRLHEAARRWENDSLKAMEVQYMETWQLQRRLHDPKWRSRVIPVPDGWIVRVPDRSPDPVAAGPVQNEALAYACPQLAERGFFEETGNASTGTHRYPGLNLRMANTPNGIRSGPPLLGEHNEYVYRDVMGYSEEQYRALEAIEQIGLGYAPGVAPFATEE